MFRAPGWPVVSVPHKLQDTSQTPCMVLLKPFSLGLKWKINSPPHSTSCGRYGIRLGKVEHYSSPTTFSIEISSKKGLSHLPTFEVLLRNLLNWESQNWFSAMTFADLRRWSTPHSGMWGHLELLVLFSDFGVSVNTKTKESHDSILLNMHSLSPGID